MMSVIGLSFLILGLVMFVTEGFYLIRANINMKVFTTRLIVARVLHTVGVVLTLMSTGAEGKTQVVIFAFYITIWVIIMATGVWSYNTMKKIKESRKQLTEAIERSFDDISLEVEKLRKEMKDL